jgi:hypothetical protein
MRYKHYTGRIFTFVKIDKTAIGKYIILKNDLTGKLENFKYTDNFKYYFKKI